MRWLEFAGLWVLLKALVYAPSVGLIVVFWPAVGLSRAVAAVALLEFWWAARLADYKIDQKRSGGSR